MKSKPKSNKTFHITEKQRTVMLLILLITAIGFIIWTQNQYQSNFVDSF